MLAGLTAATRDLQGFRHVTAMADYALRLRQQLHYVNEHSFNNFRIRIGNAQMCSSRKSTAQLLVRFRELLNWTLLKMLKRELNSRELLPHVVR